MSSCVSDEVAELLVLSVNVVHRLLITLDDCSLCSILFIVLLFDMSCPNLCTLQPKVQPIILVQNYLTILDIAMVLGSVGFTVHSRWFDYFEALADRRRARI